MPPQIATVLCILGILGLFWLDRDPEARTSKALWVPVLWLLINGSRPVSVWLEVGPTMDSPEKYLDGSPLDACVWAILLAGGLVVLIGRRRQVGPLLRANWPIVLFFSYCALSTLWSDYTFVAFKRWTKAVGDVVMVLVVLTDPEPVAALKRLLARAAFLLVPLSVLFIKYYPDLGRSYNPWTWMPSYCGVTMGKNLLGMACLICGLGSLWRFLDAYQDPKGRERTRRLIAHSVILAMVFWLFWMANSMTSLSCFVIAGGLMILASLTRVARGPAVLHLLVAAAVSVPLFALFSGSGGGMVESMGRDPTLTGRTAIWNTVLTLAGNPLAGAGFESFWLGDRLQRVWNASGQHIQEAHNGYLEVYLNLGWIGVTLLAVLIVAGYINVIRAFRRNQDASSLRLAFFAAGVIYSFTEAGFRMMALIWIAFLLAVITGPDDLLQEGSPSLVTEPAPNFAEFEPAFRQRAKGVLLLPHASMNLESQSLPPFVAMHKLTADPDRVV
jgi:O-antigen ligase